MVLTVLIVGLARDRGPASQVTSPGVALGAGPDQTTRPSSTDPWPNKTIQTQQPGRHGARRRTALSSPSAVPVVDHREPFVPEESKVAARAADSKSGDDTVVLAVGDLLGVTDAFVITSGRNTRQVKTIVDEVERQVKEAFGRGPLRVEGLDDARWVLMDYGDFLVHVFLDEARRVLRPRAPVGRCAEDPVADADRRVTEAPGRSARGHVWHRPR